MDSPSATAENFAEWESQVGKAILRFGDIELVSIRLVAAISPDTGQDAIAKIPFVRRAQRLIDFLESKKDLSEANASLLESFARAKDLAQTRNTLAHNPLMLDIFVNSDESEVFVEHSITSVRDENDRLDLAALKEFAGEVDDLSSDIWRDYLKTTGKSSDLWRVHDPESGGK